MELINNLRKLVASLSESKYRKRHLLFKAEGTKCVEDTLGHFNLYALFVTDDWLRRNQVKVDCEKICVVSQSIIDSMSALSTPSSVIAVYEIPQNTEDFSFLNSALTIALDSVQDPGNMGTIIRTADWFGVRHIICSPTTVDVYNPKVVQSTMGAISRVKVIYTDLVKLVSDYCTHIPVYGMSLKGNNIYNAPLSANGIIIMGNEGKGISHELTECITNHLLIPSYPLGVETSESLNVAVATAITLAEFRRRVLQ